MDSVFYVARAAYSPNPAVAASWAKELQARPTSKARRLSSTGLCPSLPPSRALKVNMDLTPPSFFRESVYIRLSDVPVAETREVELSVMLDPLMKTLNSLQQGFLPASYTPHGSGLPPRNQVAFSMYSTSR